MTRTVIRVAVAAGACVVRITKMSEITNSVAITTIGTTTPMTTTIRVLTASLGDGRPRLSQAAPSRTAMRTKPTQDAPSIHHHRLAMSRAWWLAGERGLTDGDYPREKPAKQIRT